MKFSEVITRLESMASALRNDFQPIPTAGNVEALTKAVDMLECAAELALTEPQPEIRHEVASTSTAEDFAEIVRRSVESTRTFLASATKVCTRKHNCAASPEPCNGEPKLGIVWNGRVLMNSDQ